MSLEGCRHGPTSLGFGPDCQRCREEDQAALEVDPLLREELFAIGQKVRDRARAQERSESPTYASLQYRWLHDPEFHARVHGAVALLEVEYAKDHGQPLEEKDRAFARLAAGFGIAFVEMERAQ